MYRSAGVFAILAAIVGLLYSISFVVLRNPLLYSIFLALGGLFSSVAIVALYKRVRTDEGIAAGWAMVLALIAAVGSAIHGAYDLANALYPPAMPVAADLPSTIDPRGFLTFGVAGIALFTLSWLILQTGRLPRGLGYLGLLSGVLLVVIYLGRLIVLDASSPLILGPAAIEGFIVNPLWYAWLGIAFLRAPEGEAQISPGRASIAR
jgi:hypothetical protein